MIINLKNSKKLSPNDLRNSYQVQWWYIHEFYFDSLNFSELSLVNNSLEKTHRDKHSLLFWQSVPYLEKSALCVRISFWWRFTKKNNDSMILTTKKKLFNMSLAITPLKFKKNKFWALLSEWVQKELNYSGQYQKPYTNSHNNSTTIIYSKWAKSRCAIISRG